MLTRRKFIKGSMATLVLVPLAGCSSDDGSPMDAGNNGNGGGSCQGVSSTGSNSAGHIHTLCVPDSDLSSPPANGVTYTTSSDSGHTHSVNLNQAQLQTIAGGGSVTVTSSSTGHTHEFIVRKP
jgi:hypothetical protein